MPWRRNNRHSRKTHAALTKCLITVSGGLHGLTSARPRRAMQGSMLGRDTRLHAPNTGHRHTLCAPLPGSGGTGIGLSTSFRLPATLHLIKPGITVGRWLCQHWCALRQSSEWEAASTLLSTNLLSHLNLAFGPDRLLLPCSSSVRPRMWHTPATCGILQPDSDLPSPERGVAAAQRLKVLHRLTDPCSWEWVRPRTRRWAGHPTLDVSSGIRHDIVRQRG